MIKRAFILTFVALAAAAGYAGCGDGAEDSEKSTTTTASDDITIPFWDNGPRSIDKVAYLKRANAVCNRVRSQMPKSFEGRYRNVNSGKIYTEATASIFLPGIQLWFDDVAYVGAPPGERRQVEDFLTAMQRAVYASEEQHIVASRQLIAQFADYNKLARNYGLDRCLVEGMPFATS